MLRRSRTLRSPAGRMLLTKSAIEEGLIAGFCTAEFHIGVQIDPRWMLQEAKGRSRFDVRLVRVHHLSSTTA